MDTLLIVNAGSSSVKFQIFGMNGSARLECLIRGQMDGIGTRPRLRANAVKGGPLIDQSYAAEQVPDVPAAMRSRYDGIVDRIQFYAPYRSDPERWKQVLAGFRD